MKRLVFFCFCAAAALSIIPTGIACWEDGLNIESKFNFKQPDQLLLLELPGLAAQVTEQSPATDLAGENGTGTETEEHQDNGDENAGNDGVPHGSDLNGGQSGSSPDTGSTPDNTATSGPGAETDASSAGSEGSAASSGESSSSAAAANDSGSSDLGSGGSSAGSGESSSSGDSGSGDGSSAE